MLCLLYLWIPRAAVAGRRTGGAKTITLPLGCYGHSRDGMETAFIRAVFQMEIFNFISLRSCSAVWERVGERGLDWIGVCVCVFYVCTCGVCVCVSVCLFVCVSLCVHLWVYVC